MTDFFLYGTLRHLPLLEIVLGRVAQAVPAELEGHGVYWAEGESFPFIHPEPGALCKGLLVRVDEGERARLDLYELGFGYEVRKVAVRSADGASCEACVYFPKQGQWSPQAPWHLEDWQRRWGAIATEAAREFMRCAGRHPPEALSVRYPMMLARAASALRAAQPRAAQPREADLRRAAVAGDVEVLRHESPYAQFFAVEEVDLRFRRFDGGFSDVVRRAGFIMSDAVTVLPYDPARDRVLVVEQFRAGPFLRGDSNPWSLEAVAGRIDPGETPEAAALRETTEETGVQLHRLEPLPAHYPSPGAVTEYLHAFIGIADLPDSAARIGGVASEQENIRGHVIGFEELMGLVDSGAADNGPLILSALWLSRLRERLRSGA